MPDLCYRCLIVDDEALARELIAAHLKQLPQFEVVGLCASAIEASQFISQHTIDLMFLDIEMPVLKGTDFYQHLAHKPQVIFTTAHRDYALDGFDLEAVDYLLKPITFARFFKAIERFLARQQKPSHVASPEAKEHLFVRCDRKEVKINFAEVVYIQGLKDYIEIHTASNTWVVKSTLSAFLKQLPQSFIQVHRSYLINTQHVTAYTKQDVELGEVEIPIGETYQVDVIKKLQ